MVKVGMFFEKEKTAIIEPYTLAEILENFLGTYKAKPLVSWDFKENQIFDRVIVPYLQVYSKNYGFSDRIKPHLLLECLINYIPLTKNRVSGTIKQEVNEIFFVNKNVCAYAKSVPNTSINKWNVYVCKELDILEQKKMLIHEVGHVYYRVQCRNYAIVNYAIDADENGMSMELMLDKEAERFVNKNKTFMTSLFNKLK